MHEKPGKYEDQEVTRDSHSLDENMKEALLAGRGRRSKTEQEDEHQEG